MQVEIRKGVWVEMKPEPWMYRPVKTKAQIDREHRQLPSAEGPEPAAVHLDSASFAHVLRCNDSAHEADCSRAGTAQAAAGPST